jgi:hypothetical protein
LRTPGRGVLRRRPVKALPALRYIGKESNSLDEVKAGWVSELDGVLNEYRAAGSEWSESVQWVLKQIPKTTIKEKTGLSPRAIIAARNGRRPHPKNKALLLALAGEYARAELRRAGANAPTSDVDVCEVLYVRSLEIATNEDAIVLNRVLRGK